MSCCADFTTACCIYISVVIEPGCISTGDNVNVTCTCPQEACSNGSAIQVEKNGTGIDLVSYHLDFDDDPCRIVYTFQADSTVDDGANFSCSVVSSQYKPSESVTLHMSG